MSDAFEAYMRLAVAQGVTNGLAQMQYRLDPSTITEAVLDEIRKVMGEPASEPYTCYRIADFGYGPQQESRWFGDVFDQALCLREDGYQAKVESRVHTKFVTDWQSATDPRVVKTEGAEDNQ